MVLTSGHSPVIFFYNSSFRGGHGGHGGHGPTIERILTLTRSGSTTAVHGSTRDLATALGHRPRAFGARLATPFMGKLTCRQRYGTPETDTAAHATHRSTPLHASADASTRQLWRGEALQLSGKSTGGWWAQDMEVKAAMPLRGGVRAARTSSCRYPPG